MISYWTSFSDSNSHQASLQEMAKRYTEDLSEKEGP